ncbi:unnamed protein product [Ilex paraguariensis]|uniref:Uncharacterized protein n=1 Tax=Ilex paraguariensis TaxID=185542 RepID=A0ABC8U3C0_9AQUA
MGVEVEEEEMDPEIEPETPATTKPGPLTSAPPPRHAHANVSRATSHKTNLRHIQTSVDLHESIIALPLDSLDERQVSLERGHKEMRQEVRRGGHCR